jgi:putative membrane protein
MHWAAHSGFWPLFPLFWLGLIALVGFCVTRRARWRTARAPFEGNALEILRQRYARGEIDGQTFDHMRERLEGSARPRD